MQNNDKASVYDFESQLELGELLLSLGRIQEAEVELRKARELNEIGAYSTSDDDPKRQDDLQRLAIALERVGEIQSGATKSSRLWWLVGTGGLALLLMGIFASWIFNRAELTEIAGTSTREAEFILTKESEFDKQVELSANELTRMTDLLIQRNQDGTRTAIDAERAEEMARIAATSAAMVSASGGIGGGGILSVTVQIVQVTTTPDPNATLPPTSLPRATEMPDETTEDTSSTSSDSEEDDDATPDETEEVRPTQRPRADGDTSELRITAPAANLRNGPGFDYTVLNTLKGDTLVSLIARSEDGYWYSIELEDESRGWVHTSLAKPTVLDKLPVVTITRRPTRRPIPTNTPVPYVPPAVNTPRPLPVNTPVPYVPPTNTAQPVYPTNTAQPLYMTNTPQPVYSTNTPQPVYSTNTPVPVTYPTNTSQPTYPTNTPSFATNTPQSFAATDVPTQPPPTATTIPPLPTKTTVPAATNIPSTAVPTTEPLPATATNPPPPATTTVATPLPETTTNGADAPPPTLTNPPPPTTQSISPNDTIGVGDNPTAVPDDTSTP